MLTSRFTGKLNLLQFVKSVDTVYKEAKLLRASVRNSEKIDRAFERAANVLFYVIVICVTLSRLGYDPLAMFLSLSSILLAFAFMIGTASSKMFEGFLFILIRRPVSEMTLFLFNLNNSPSCFIFQHNTFTASVQYW
jgi:small-conductance mechanosensitive channel